MTTALNQQGDDDMGKLGIGPVSINVDGESIDKATLIVSRFNPSVVVAVIFALTLISTQIGSMLYLEMVIAPENARVIGERMAVLSESISSVSDTNHKQVQSLITSHDSHIKQLIDTQKDQTQLLREIFTANHGKVPAKQASSP